jgi:large subunit ribosomal protein L18
VHGTSTRPRLAVYKSNQYMHAQLIDDEAGRSLVGIVSKVKATSGGNKTEQAHAAGKLLAEAAIKHGFTRVAFDRGGFRYGGRVQAFAEGARAGGLAF